MYTCVYNIYIYIYICTHIHIHTRFVGTSHLRRSIFMYGFCYHLNNLRFNKSQSISDLAAACVASYFASSGIQKCRLLKRLLDHPMTSNKRSIFAVMVIHRCLKKGLLRKIIHIGILAFRAPNQLLDRSFCCWVAWPRLT